AINSRTRPQTSCEPHHASLYQMLALKGRYRSGQTGQTVNLLALRLRWFESSPAQITLPESLFANSSVASSLATFPATTVSPATVAASAAAGRSRCSGASLIHGQWSAFDRLAIEFRNGVLSLLFRTHGDESKAARLARESVLHESDFLHSASL